MTTKDLVMSMTGDSCVREHLSLTTSVYVIARSMTSDSCVRGHLNQNLFFLLCIDLCSESRCFLLCINRLFGVPLLHEPCLSEILLARISGLLLCLCCLQFLSILWCAESVSRCL